MHSRSNRFINLQDNYDGAEDPVDESFVGSMIAAFKPSELTGLTLSYTSFILSISGLCSTSATSAGCTGHMGAGH